MRRKFFFSDQNIDSRDPVQLNLLYVQARDAILDGTHPVTQEKGKKKKIFLIIIHIIIGCVCARAYSLFFFSLPFFFLQLVNLLAFKHIYSLVITMNKNTNKDF